LMTELDEAKARQKETEEKLAAKEEVAENHESLKENYAKLMVELSKTKARQKEAEEKLAKIEKAAEKHESIKDDYDQIVDQGRPRNGWKTKPRMKWSPLKPNSGKQESKLK
ncbi:MAG: hypothetical protein ACLFT5_09665, partial [Desulfovermiculus sp.]